MKSNNNNFMIAIFGGVVAILICLLIYLYYRSSNETKEFGELHCGQVLTSTPDGRIAFEHECWRVK